MPYAADAAHAHGARLRFGRSGGEGGPGATRRCCLGSLRDTNRVYLDYHDPLSVREGAARRREGVVSGLRQNRRFCFGQGCNTSPLIALLLVLVWSPGTGDRGQGTKGA